MCTVLACVALQHVGPSCNAHAIWMLLALQVLANGPGTCIPVCAAAFLLRWVDQLTLTCCPCNMQQGDATTYTPSSIHWAPIPCPQLPGSYPEFAATHTPFAGFHHGYSNNSPHAVRLLSSCMRVPLAGNCPCATP